MSFLVKMKSWYCFSGSNTIYGVTSPSPIHSSSIWPSSLVSVLPFFSLWFSIFGLSIGGGRLFLGPRWMLNSANYQILHISYHLAKYFCNHGDDDYLPGVSLIWMMWLWGENINSVCIDFHFHNTGSLLTAWYSLVHSLGTVWLQFNGSLTTAREW